MACACDQRSTRGFEKDQEPCTPTCVLLWLAQLVGDNVRRLNLLKTNCASGWIQPASAKPYREFFQEFSVPSKRPAHILALKESEDPDFTIESVVKPKKSRKEKSKADPASSEIDQPVEQEKPDNVEEPIEAPEVENAALLTAQAKNVGSKRVRKSETRVDASSAIEKKVKAGSSKPMVSRCIVFCCFRKC